MSEKSMLPLADVRTSRPAPAKRNLTSRVATLCLVLLLGAYMYCNGIYGLADLLTHKSGHKHHSGQKHGSDFGCEQAKPLVPTTDHDGLNQMWDFIQTEAFRNASIRRHSGAVQIPTESFDDLGAIGEDPRWDIMYKFEEFLQQTFPLVHANLKKENVNTHGLLFTWQGSDDSLKPLVLVAHQDVVPVPNATVDAWTHPPYSGYYDGKYIWGRGSSDCKNQLIAAMETVELFLEAKWQPKRTVILSLGFDEEVSGPQGAAYLAPYLLERYGKDGVAAIVDEGSGVLDDWGRAIAAPGVGEKGYIDVVITVRMPGGHSSIPSDHTSIGVLSEIITQIEANQYPTYLADDNPFLSLLECGAAWAPEFPNKVAKLLKHRISSKTCKKNKNNKHKPDALAKEVARTGGLPARYLMQTSQAVDVISGGIKTNALPERASVTVNHRINIGDTQQTVKDRLIDLTKVVASKYNLTLHAFDSEPERGNSIILSSPKDGLEPAPVTPTRIGGSLAPYEVLAGSIKAVYGENITVSPGIMTGNTDTKYYWDLTKHIFRFAPGYDPEDDAGLGNIHTVDERISVNNHLNAVRWFTYFVRNMDAATLEGDGQ